MGEQMYLPSHFSETDEARIRKLIEENSFVTLLSFSAGEKPFVNHLPVIFSSRPGEENILIGHMAKRNPQWQHYKTNPEAMMIVQGPHAYITPSWYQSGREVPTWNYASVHLEGKIRLLESFHDQVWVLQQLTAFYEKPNPNPWEFELPPDLMDEKALTSAIVSFQFQIEKVEAKFKLSQNRSAEDKHGVIEGLGQRNDEMSHAVRSMMIENESQVQKKTPR